MKIVKEHINEKFTEDSDPIHDLGIGIMQQILDWFYKEEHKKFDNDYKFLNAQGYDALLVLLIYRNKYKLASLLIQIKEKEINFEADHNLPLRWASAQGNIKLMKIIISRGGNPSDDENGYNSLDCAIINKRKEAVKFLIKIGTKFNAHTNSLLIDHKFEDLLKK
jgi:ankyrin repeat protein